MGRLILPPQSDLALKLQRPSLLNITRKPGGILAPRPALLPANFASIAVLNEQDDGIKHFGPGGNFGNIDRFVNTAHTWFPEGPAFLANNSALRTSGTFDMDSADVTAFIWWRSLIAPGTDPPSFSYWLYCANAFDYSVRYIHETGSTQFELYIDNSSAIGTAGDYNFLFDGAWHLLAYSRRASDQQTQLWIDGQQAATSTAGTIVSDFLCFGGRDDGTVRYSGGIVGVAGYYDRILTPKEHAQIWESEFRAYSDGALPAIIGPAAAGVTITSTGALTEPAGTLAGVAEREVTGTAALSEPPGSLAGVVERGINTTGALDEPAGELSALVFRELDATGALSEPPGTLAGVASTGAAHNATGALSEPAGTLAGVATREVTGQGALSEPPGTLAGTATREITSQGALNEPPGTIAGSGTREITCTGALNEPPGVLFGRDIPSDIGGAGRARQFMKNVGRGMS